MTATVIYFLSQPIIASYQRGRIHRLKERFENRRRLQEAARVAAKAALADTKERAATGNTNAEGGRQ